MFTISIRFHTRELFYSKGKTKNLKFIYESTFQRQTNIKKKYFSNFFNGFIFAYRAWPCEYLYYLCHKMYALDENVPKGKGYIRDTKFKYAEHEAANNKRVLKMLALSARKFSKFF